MARGRRPKYREKRGSFTYYLPLKLARKLKAEAKKAGATASDFLAEILKKELEKKGGKND